MGPDGVLTALRQRLVNAALSGEADSHIRQEKAGGQSNRRNGYTSKTLDTGVGRQILAMYANGNSFGDIQHHVKQPYGLYPARPRWPR